MFNATLSLIKYKWRILTTRTVRTLYLPVLSNSSAPDSGTFFTRTGGADENCNHRPTWLRRDAASLTRLFHPEPGKKGFDAATVKRCTHLQLKRFRYLREGLSMPHRTTEPISPERWGLSNSLQAFCLRLSLVHHYATYCSMCHSGKWKVASEQSYSIAIYPRKSSSASGLVEM